MQQLEPLAARAGVLEEQQEALNECSTLAAAVLLADPSIYDSI